MMLTYLRADTCDAQKKIDAATGCYARFSFLNKLYIDHMLVTVEAGGDDK